MFTFILGFIVVLVTLYLPGYLIGRALSLSRTAALAFAPALGIAPLTALGVVLQKAGISCPAPALLAVLLALALVAFALGAGAPRRKGAVSLPKRFNVLLGSPMEEKEPSFAWKACALYVVVGLAVSAFMFLTAIDGLDSFARKDDTTVHLSIVRAFLDTGTYSTLSSGSFLGQGAEGSYYPSAWHIVVAIAASFIGDSVTVATNAATLAFTAVVLPLGLCLLLGTVFPQRRNVVLAGSLFATTFAILPWGFLTKGQLLPNMASYSLIPATIALFVSCLEAPGRKSKALLGTSAAWGVVSIALCQPNGAFTCVIGMLSYALCRIFRGPNDERATINAKSVAQAALLVVASCALWVALFYAPPLRSVVTYGQWDTLLSLPQALASGLSFMYVKWGGIQPILSVLVLLGFIATLRQRRYLWLSVAYFITFVIYLGNMTLEGFPRQLIAGFWYADYYRTSAMNALFALPLAALGLAWLIQLASRCLARIPRLQSRTTARSAIATAAFLVVFVVCQTAPFSFSVGGFKIENGLMTMRQQISNLYSWDATYTGEEREFVQEALEEIDDGALVVNVPNDGTAWAYGTDGINTLFRRTGDNGSNPFQPETNEIIREHLCEIASNEEVRRAVADVNAGYVILLDDPSSDNPTTDSQRYKQEKWVGVESITSETPGFELIASEGDMRLYAIDVPAE